MYNHLKNINPSICIWKRLGISGVSISTGVKRTKRLLELSDISRIAYYKKKACVLLISQLARINKYISPCTLSI